VPDRGSVGRRGSLGLAAAAAFVLAVCLASCGGDEGGDPQAYPAGPTGETASTTTSTGSGQPVPAAEADDRDDADAGEAAEPVRVQLPSIGVDAPMVPLGLDAAGALEAPDGMAETGWWTGGPEPGEAGPAVIAGHVDSQEGPAVFFRLRELRAGDTVNVLRADGSQVEFVVERLERHPKDEFPTGAVYGDTPGPTLRLITCGGDFDRSSGHYRDNVIAYAAPVA
jgi:sortase (surface protein transpeptidase)